MSNPLDNQAAKNDVSHHLPSSINKLSVESEKADTSDPAAYELMYQSESTRIFFSSGNLGIKVVIDPSLDAQQRHDLLQHELKVSNILPSSCPKRKVLRVDTSQGIPVMYFEWVDGVTVGEWLRPEEDESNQLADHAESLQYANLTLKERLLVVLAITRAVRDFQEAGLFHGQINLSNIVLDFTGGAVDRCSAVLIDYSKSIIVSESSFAILDEKHRKAYVDAKNQKDLTDLGLLIYYVLSNGIPDSYQNQNQDDDNTSSEDDLDVHRNKRGKSQVVQQKHDLPMYRLFPRHSRH